MTRRHKPVVVLLTVEDFAVLEASAAASHQDPYLHAHWLLAQSLGTTPPAEEREAVGSSEARP